MPLKKSINSLFAGFLCAILSLFTACEKHPKCWGDDKKKGVIIDELEINCPPAIHSSTYIVTSDSSYKNLFSLSCSLPEIDFNQVSLLGFFTSGSGCNTKYIREVIVHKTEPHFDYNVTIRNCGFCFESDVHFNWVTVPKLPEGWSVKFNFVAK